MAKISKLIAPAVKAGRKTYRGSDCKRKHGGLRWVSTRTCVECERKATKKRRKAAAA